MARSSLIWYRGRTDVDDEINEMAREKQAHLGEQPFRWQELFDKKMRRAVTIIILLQVRHSLHDCSRPGIPYEWPTLSLTLMWPDMFYSLKWPMGVIYPQVYHISTSR